MQNFLWNNFRAELHHFLGDFLQHAEVNDTSSSEGQWVFILFSNKYI